MVVRIGVTPSRPTKAKWRVCTDWLVLTARDYVIQEEILRFCADQSDTEAVIILTKHETWRRYSDAEACSSPLVFLLTCWSKKHTRVGDFYRSQGHNPQGYWALRGFRWVTKTANVTHRNSPKP
jgi:hypothetical protein